VQPIRVGTVAGMSTNDGDNETYHGYSVDDETQPQDTGDSLADSDRGVADPLDEGYSPPEKWSAGQGYGNTPLEEEMGETLDQRLAQEVPEPDPYASPAETGDEDAGDVVDSSEIEAGPVRAGRLVAEDEGAHTDTEKDLTAWDVGIDGAAASAEEAAVHLVVDDEDEPPV
jgi:hypothetical protein